MAVSDIVPVPGAQFEETLASASPDVLRAMIREFAQRMMDADVEVACGAGYGEVTPDRVNSRNGYRRREWDTRAGTIELAIPKLRPGVVLSGVPGAPAAGRAGAGLSGGHVVPAGGFHPAGGEARCLPRRGGPIQVAGQRGGRRAGRSRGGLPEPAAGPRAVHVRVDRRAEPEGPRGRPYRQRALPDRHRRQRRRVPGDPRHRRDQLRGRRGVASVPARPGRPRPVRRAAGDQRRSRRAGQRYRRGLARAAWQRCRTHYHRNLLTRVPKTAQPWVPALVRTIFEQPDPASVRAQHAQVVAALEAGRLSDAVAARYSWPTPDRRARAVREITVDADAPQILVGIDGETIMMPTPGRCAIRPRALRVLLPRQRPGVPAPKPPLDRPGSANSPPSGDTIRRRSVVYDQADAVCDEPEAEDQAPPDDDLVGMAVYPGPEPGQELLFKGLSTLGSDLARFRARPPACYRAPWRQPAPDLHRQATTSF